MFVTTSARTGLTCHRVVTNAPRSVPLAAGHWETLALRAGFPRNSGPGGRVPRTNEGWDDLRADGQGARRAGGRARAGHGRVRRPRAADGGADRRGGQGE